MWQLEIGIILRTDTRVALVSGNGCVGKDTIFFNCYAFFVKKS